ncbi:hypothetical protein Tco_0934882 [Tanacetum coccineum]
MGLWYSKDFGCELIAYSDAEHAGCKDDCKSTSGGLQFLSEKLVSWSSKKQDCTAMSTAEAEYVSLSACCAQVIWMRTQLLDYGYKYNRIPMYCDSKSAEDESKYRLSFMLDRKELTLTLDDFRTIFELPQATNNNHEHFFAAPKFSEMIMQMLYCFVHNIHVDYADLLWEGLHYSLEHSSTLIHYPRFTKLIVSHYMTAFPEISRRARDKYHNLEDDMMVKNILNSGKHKDGIGMKIPIIMKYLVKVSKRRTFWSLNEDILKIIDYDYEYAVSIKEDMAYPCLHSPKTTKERRSIHRWTIQTLLWRNTSGSRKKKLENMVKCLTRKLLSMVRSSMMKTGTDNQEKDEKQSQNDKTGHGMEKL